MGLLSDPPACRGTLRISRFDGPASDETLPVHTSSFVRGRGCDSMEDNDLRGFVDGKFFLGWNQPTQTHVRIGRVGYGGPSSSSPAGCSPTYGEHELFRVLQRWEGMRLPSGARILSARLNLTVEWDGPGARRLLLYAVHKDWKPGGGGVHGNNASVPKPGEVWWNDVGHGDESWGLPGAGFASDVHCEADTPATALADAVFDGSSQIVGFESPQLAAYIDQRLISGQPLLFLLKASDFQEDIPGAQLSFYSANSGDTHDLSRRPRLDLEWRHPREIVVYEALMLLEAGRTTEITLPTGAAQAVDHWVEFDSAVGYGQPSIRARHAGSVSGGWLPVPHGVRSAANELKVSILAAAAPVSFGGIFEAAIADTWLTSGLPEEQEIRWEFTSPSGAVHSLLADYTGQFTWTVRFRPDELGRWRYTWSYDLNYERRGPEGGFDVVCEEIAEVADGLDRLRVRIEAAHAAAESAQLEKERVSFSRLQRAAMYLLAGHSSASEENQRIRERLDAVRAVLWGRPIPDEIPMRSMARLTEMDGKKLAEPILQAEPVSKRKAVRRWQRLTRFLKARLRSLAD